MAASRLLRRTWNASTGAICHRPVRRGHQVRQARPGRTNGGTRAVCWTGESLVVGGPGSPRARFEERLRPTSWEARWRLNVWQKKGGVIRVAVFQGGCGPSIVSASPRRAGCIIHEQAIGHVMTSTAQRGDRPDRCSADREQRGAAAASFDVPVPRRRSGRSRRCWLRAEIARPVRLSDHPLLGLIARDECREPTATVRPAQFGSARKTQERGQRARQGQKAAVPQSAGSVRRAGARVSQAGERTLGGRAHDGRDHSSDGRDRKVLVLPANLPDLH